MAPKRRASPNLFCSYTLCIYSVWNLKRNLFICFSQLLWLMWNFLSSFFSILSLHWCCCWTCFFFNLFLVTFEWILNENIHFLPVISKACTWLLHIFCVLWMLSAGWPSMGALLSGGVLFCINKNIERKIKINSCIDFFHACVILLMDYKGIWFIWGIFQNIY